MTTTTQDPADRYTLRAEELRRIRDTHAHGIMGWVHLLFYEFFMRLLRLFASLPEPVGTGDLPDTAPAPSRSASAAGGAAAGDHQADEAESRTCVQRCHAGVSPRRASQDAGADRADAAGGPQLAPAVADAGGQASAPAAAAARTNGKASIRPRVRAPAGRGPRLLAALARTGDTLDYETRAFVIPCEKTGLRGRRRLASITFRLRNYGWLPPPLTANSKRRMGKRSATHRPTPPASRATPQPPTRFPHW